MINHTTFSTDPRKHFFDGQAPTWNNPENDYTQHPRFSSWWQDLKVQAGNRVLEIGCGTGLILPRLEKAVGAEGMVVALDISPQMLLIAKSQNPTGRINFSQGEARRLPFADAVFNHLLMIHVYPHLHPRLESILECRRILAPQGLLHLVHFCSRSCINDIHRKAGGCITEDRLPPAEAVSRVFESVGFKVLCCEESDSYYELKFLGK